MRPHMNIPRIALVLLASLICVGCSDASEEPTPEPTPDLTGGGEKVVELYDNGAVKVTGYQLEDGTRVGHWTHWHENGQKIPELEYKNREKERP